MLTGAEKKMSPAHPCGEPGWAATLATELEGELDLSALARRLYAQDASIYEQWPLGVARPRSARDCRAIVRAAAAHGFGVIARGGGTSLAGQCVGDGLVVEFTRHMNRVLQMDAVARRAVVEPGLVQDDLNDAAAPYGLMFAPDTSTSRQAAIGGMIGNNSCGAFSVLFGTTRDHVEGLEVVLADGELARLGPLDDEALRRQMEEPSAIGRITRDIVRLVDLHRQVILRNAPKPSVRRRNAGYALDALATGRPWVPDGPPFNLARLICGSEGTLALVTAAELRLVPRPKERGLMCIHFGSVLEACAAVPRLLAHGPAAIELMDGALLNATEHHAEYRRDRFWVVGVPGAVLAVELWAETAAELARRMTELERDAAAAGLGYARPVVAAGRIARVWALRKAGLGLLTGVPGDAKPATAIEDIAVAPEDLAEFVREIGALMAAIGCSCVYYGHASVGLLHYRPMLNLKEPTDFEKFQRLCEAVVPLVRRFGGSLSGEHGDGRLRSPFLREALGSELYELCKEVKRIFDPQGVLNPGKIVDPRPLTADLRVSPASRTPEVRTEYDWSRTLGYVRAVEACNGVGQCRQSSGRGLMCPTYMATGDEAMTTRARANLLRQALTAGDEQMAWLDKDVAAVLDTCVMCKGCRTECPSGVDMARIKAEWLQHHHDRCRPDLRSRVFAAFATLARGARLAPRLTARLVNLPVVKRVLRIAPQRTLPAYATETFAENWHRRRTPTKGPRGTLVLYCDEFTDSLEPEIAWAAVSVLEALGWQVEAVTGVESARSWISKGFLRVARRRLDRAVKCLDRWASQGVRIVGLEPSALLTFVDEAPDLVSPAVRGAALRVKEACQLFDDLIAETEDAGERAAWRPLPVAHALLHVHCHQKALVGSAGTRRALALIPNLRITELATACCGMAGAFGYEEEHYELSMRLANQILFPAIRREPEAWICATGTSCRRQILDGTGRRAWSLPELLAFSLGLRPPQEA
ncbi:MAG: FAD-binding protein [Kiritimatiellae bacterium]|nr:FAD-binding protein [Kiritimatiellia bacterium]